MKHTRLTVFLAFVLSAGSLSAQESSFESASQAVLRMGTGWNLGNTFDSHAADISDVTASDTFAFHWNMAVQRKPVVYCMI